MLSLDTTVSNQDGSIDIDAISSISKQLKDIVALRRSIRIVVITGAGGLGREYGHFAREHTGKQADLDSLGIKASQVNALLLMSVLQNQGLVTNVSIPQQIEDLEKYLSNPAFECLVSGGLEPGMTSNSTAASIARKVKNSILVVVSRTEGIRPDSEDAMTGGKILQSIDREYLKRIISKRPKEHVLDEQTCKILLSKKSEGMKVIVTDYEKICETTKAVISSRTTGKVIEGATRIFI